jgi:hypothetical protein
LTAATAQDLGRVPADTAACRAGGRARAGRVAGVGDSPRHQIRTAGRAQPTMWPPCAPPDNTTRCGEQPEAGVCTAANCFASASSPTSRPDPVTKRQPCCTAHPQEMDGLLVAELRGSRELAPSGAPCRGRQRGRNRDEALEIGAEEPEVGSSWRELHPPAGPRNSGPPDPIRTARPPSRRRRGSVCRPTTFPGARRTARRAVPPPIRSAAEYPSPCWHRPMSPVPHRQRTACR